MGLHKGQTNKGSFKKGNIYSHWTGKKRNEEFKTKVKERMLKNNPFKGKKHTEETKQKMSLAKLGKKGHNKDKHWKVSKDKLCNMGKQKKEKHWNWKGGITKLNKLIRNLVIYKKWRSDIFSRDNWTCQTCRKRGIFLEAHHIKKFNIIIKENNIDSIKKAIKCKELWNLNNGVSLCLDCHNLTKRGRV